MDIDECAQLRAAGVRGPTTALSAATMPADIARGKDIGFDAYLTKPSGPRICVPPYAHFDRRAGSHRARGA